MKALGLLSTAEGFLSFCSLSADEIGEDLFILRMGRPVLFPELDTPEQPRHIFAEVAHRHHALFVLLHFFGLRAVNVIPIGGRDDRHRTNGKIFVDDVHRRHIPRPPRAQNRRRWFESKVFSARIKRTVHDR